MGDNSVSFFSGVKKAHPPVLVTALVMKDLGIIELL
jgi:hypothetical protein